MIHASSRLGALIAAALVVAPAQAPAAPPEVGAPQASAVAWPEADALFHRDPRWLGGDGAWTVDLGHGRVLWLFADSFATNKPLPGRRGSAFIHNSVAIQSGYDPTTATFDASWQTADDKPQSFFADDGDCWYWPGDGELIDGRLIVFLVRIERSDRGLGFKVLEWTAVVIDNPHDPPSQWRPRTLKTPANTWSAIIGFGSAAVEGDHLYVFGFGKAPGHPQYLVRWPKSAVSRGDLSQPEWHTGDDRWTPHDELVDLPPPSAPGGQTEFSVHRDPPSQRRLHLQTAFFPVGPLALRTAPALTGPWSAPVNFFAPPEMKMPREGFYMYSAKAHPELAADGALAATYCTNHRNLGTLIDDATLYYPRFVRVKLDPASARPAAK